MSQPEDAVIALSLDASGGCRLTALLLVQACCLAFALIAAAAARKTLREGFYLTETRKVGGTTARILAAAMWLVVASSFVAIGLVILMRSP